jgi:hypothetical protein
MSRVAWWVVVLSLLWASPLRAQGRLQQARQDTVYRPDAPAAPSTGSGSSSNSSSSSDGSWSSGGDGEAIGYLLLFAGIGVTSPLWAPSLMLNDSLGNPGYFPHYPYSDDLEEYLHIGPPGTEPDQPEIGFGDPQYLKSWSVRLSIEDGNDFRGLNRLNGRLFVDTTLRLGLWTNWNYLHESLDGGRSDETLLSDTNLTFRIAQSEHVEIHAGAGLRVLQDHTGTRYGGNFLYSTDLFLVKPLVVSALVDGGWLDSTGVVHGRATFGVVAHGWEVFIGYDFMHLGSVNIQGPVAGLRFWF